MKKCKTALQELSEYNKNIRNGLIKSILPDRSKTIFTKYILYMGDKNVTWYSDESLMIELGMKKTTFYKYKRIIFDEGFLKKSEMPCPDGTRKLVELTNRLSSENEEASHKRRDSYFDKKVEKCGTVISDIYSVDEYQINEVYESIASKEVIEDIRSNCAKFNKKVRNTNTNINNNIKNKDNIISVDRTSNVEKESLSKNQLSFEKKCTPVHTKTNQDIPVDKKVCDTVSKEESIDLEKISLNKMNTKNRASFEQYSKWPVIGITGLLQADTSLKAIIRNSGVGGQSLVEIFTPNHENIVLAIELSRDVNYIIKKIIRYYEQQQFIPRNPQLVIKQWILSERQTAHYLSSNFKPDQNCVNHAKSLGISEIQLNELLPDFHKKNEGRKVIDWQKFFIGYLNNYLEYKQAGCRSNNLHLSKSNPDVVKPNHKWHVKDEFIPISTPESQKRRDDAIAQFRAERQKLKSIGYGLRK